MKILLIGVLAFTLLMPQQLVAQQGQGRMKSDRGWDKSSSYCTKYNSGIKAELKGEIISIEKFYPEKGSSYGLQLNIKTTAGNQKVHLGPGWYMEKQEMQLKVGDIIEVEGHKVMFNDENVIMAREVERGEMKMKLRDDSGNPVWRGNRKS